MEHRKGRKKPSSRQKTPAKTPAAELEAVNSKVNKDVNSPPAGVSLEVQEHGGALKRGGNPGNKGGTGRPPNLIRSELRGSYDEHKAFLDRVVAGEVMVQIQFPVPELVRHVRCKCGKLEISSVDAMLETITVKTSASVKDRIAALEHQAKYSLGQLKEISVEMIKEKLERQLELLRNRFSGEVLASLQKDLREIWNS